MSETNRIEYKQELTESLEKEVIAFLNSVADGVINIGIDKVVEQLGTGIPRILESYPKECFKFSDNFLRMSFPVSIEVTDGFHDEGTIKGGPIRGSIGGLIGSPISDLTQRQNEVLNFLRENNKLTRRDLARLLGVNVSASQAHIEILKNKGYITRIGGTRGYWQIIK